MAQVRASGCIHGHQRIWREILRSTSITGEVATGDDTDATGTGDERLPDGPFGLYVDFTLFLLVLTSWITIS